jgi:outer membrane receptor for ferric coprogen and ferric-rhodotorulic acid
MRRRRARQHQPAARASAGLEPPGQPRQRRSNDPRQPARTDTEYKGIEFTATKRFSAKWQMQAGFTIGKNEGGFGGAGPE